MNLSKLLPDRTLAKAGVWRTFIPPTEPDETFEVKVAYSLPAYREEVEKRFAAARRDLDGARIGSTQSAELQTRALVGTLLLDWRGLEQDGQPVAFDEETAFQVMNAYPALEFFVRDAAGDVRLFQEKPQSITTVTEGDAGQASDLKSGGALEPQLPGTSPAA